MAGCRLQQLQLLQLHHRRFSAAAQPGMPASKEPPKKEQDVDGTSTSSSSTTSPLPNAVVSAGNLASGITGFLIFDAGVKAVMIQTGLATYLPTQIGGMLASFSVLTTGALLNKQAAERIHSYLMPSVGFVNKWLPVCLCPVQVMLPTIHLPGGGMEVASLLAFLGGSWLFSIAFAARLTSGIAALASSGVPQSSVGGAGVPPRLPVSVPAFWLCVAAAAFGGGVMLPASDEVAEDSVVSGKFVRGVCLAALGAGGFAVGLHRGLPGHISFLYCGGTTMLGGGLLATARGESFEEVVRRDYIAPDGKGAGDRLLWFLGPALVATGVQIFQYRERIQKYGTILLAASAASSLANILSTVAVAPLMGISTSTSLAATVRCVTVPMGLPCYEQLCHAEGIDFNIGLLALCAGISGFLGFAVGKSLLAKMGHSVDQALVRGIAIGSSSHVLGSATLAGAETEAFAWGMLATAVSGVCSAFWLCGCPPVMHLTVQLANRGASKSEE